MVLNGKVLVHRHSHRQVMPLGPGECPSHYQRRTKDWGPSHCLPLTLKPSWGDSHRSVGHGGSSSPDSGADTGPGDTHAWTPYAKDPDDS